MLTIPETRPTIPSPRSIEECGVRRSLLEDLALKIIYFEGDLNLRELAEKMGLAFAVADELFQRLRRARFVEVTGMDGHVHRVSTSAQGAARAQELLAINHYAGAAPVAFEDYVRRVREQSVGRVDVRVEDVQRAFAPLVLGDEMLRELGTAILSGTSIVLYGPTGTGKTAIAERIPHAYQGSVWIPHAVAIDDQIITVFDPMVHRPLDEPAGTAGDRRWVRCERPWVVVGGELTIEMLDLQFNAVSGLYAAPLQMKANNGVLVIDDFGRQRVSPEALLNRWTVPLDRKIDFLTLRGGKKFEMPFDSLVVFSTNLEPAAVFTTATDRAAVIDDAFLRRIPNKIRIGYITRDQFHEIFRRVCVQFGVAYQAVVVEQLTDVIGDALNQPLRPCYARDIVQQVCWEARFEQREPTLDWPSVARACRRYFLWPDAPEAGTRAAMS